MMTRLSLTVFLLAGIASLAGLTGCAAEVYSINPQTYTVTVTSSAASVSQTAKVTLAVN
jgi:ABC-type transporter Mla subunit MlaD